MIFSRGFRSSVCGRYGTVASLAGHPIGMSTYTFSLDGRPRIYKGSPLSAEAHSCRLTLLMCEPAPSGVLVSVARLALCLRVALVAPGAGAWPRTEPR